MFAIYFFYVSYIFFSVIYIFDYDKTYQVIFFILTHYFLIVIWKLKTVCILIKIYFDRFIHKYYNLQIKYFAIYATY